MAQKEIRRPEDLVGKKIGIVGFGRMWYGAHWPTDVIGAYALGGAVLTVLVALYRRLDAEVGRLPLIKAAVPNHTEPRPHTHALTSVVIFNGESVSKVYSPGLLPRALYWLAFQAPFPYIRNRAALNAGGRTIGVLACGLDMVYPPEHARLAQEIMQNGALISDYPLGTQPRSEFFPRRNRILSAVTLGVLVVEGGEDSGALLTARYALEQDREVFAVPGSIYSPTQRGSNKLIRDGEAKLVTATEDILEELNLTMVTQQLELREATPADPTEARLLSILSNQPSHIDDVQRASGLPIAAVSSTLAVLELKGMVRQVGPMSFVKAR